MQDLQSAWLILLHCAAARANYQIRCVSPGGVAQFVLHHDEQIWDCACNILQLDPRDAEVGREFSTAPLDGRPRIAQRQQTEGACILGQLGGLFGNDPPATPRSRSPVGGSIGGVSRHPSFAGSIHGSQITAWCHGFRTAFVARTGSWSPARTANQRSLRSGAKAGGNTRRRRGSRGGSAMSISSAGWMTQPSPCCDHGVALVLVWQCRRAPHVV